MKVQVRLGELGPRVNRTPLCHPVCCVVVPPQGERGEPLSLLREGDVLSDLDVDDLFLDLNFFTFA